MDLLGYFKYRLFWVWLICMFDLLWLGWVGVLDVKRLVLCMVCLLLVLVGGFGVGFCLCLIAFITSLLLFG